MPGPILHLGASVLCAHGGQATPTVPFPRVLVGGQPGDHLEHPVRGGRLPVPAGVRRAMRHGPMGRRCDAGAGGRDPGRDPGQAAICVPTGTPLLPIVVQPRVVAT